MKKTPVIILSLCLSAALVLSGCGGKNSPAVTPSDVASSHEKRKPAAPAEAVEVCVDGEQNDEVFLLQYNWYGSQFVSDDSFNKIMMDKYASEGCHAPYVRQEAELSFVFGSSEEIPSVMKLTQYANTVRANSGIPYDTLEPELARKDDSTYGFTVDFREFKMYYYLLECEWQNGNQAQYAFAVEKAE